MNAEEVLADLQEKLGTDFGTDYNNLTNAYLNILVEWRFYRSLFGTNPERVSLLNKCSGILFYVIEKSLFESVVLGLCRVLDPAATGHGQRARHNMTFRRLVDHLPEGDLRTGYSDTLDAAVANSGFARDWRNRRLAHSDFEVAQGTTELQSASRESVQTLIDSVGELILYVHRNCLDSDYLLEPTLPIEDEMRFLRLLNAAVEDEEARMEHNRAALERHAHAEYDNGPEVPDWLVNRG